MLLLELLLLELLLLLLLQLLLELLLLELRRDGKRLAGAEGTRRRQG